MSRAIDTLIIHCADTPNGRHFTADDIDDWHAERGWRRDEGARLAHHPEHQAIGYHWVIAVTGEIQPGRHPDEIGAHARGHNEHSIGICMVGRDKFTPAQWAALKTLVARFTMQTAPPRVIGHRDVDAHKTCPGFDVAAWLAAGMIPAPEHIEDAP